MLFQPSNIYPSTFSGIGAGTVDVTQDLNVSWQVNGDTPMTAYQIKIYQNDPGSTLMYDSGSVSVSPVFEPHDKYGNATYFTAIISAAALSTAGIVNGYQYGYKMLITQWWGVSDYVEQTSASVFITRSTPTLAINTITTPVASNSLTITANYSQAQGDPISTVEWVFALAGSESTPIRKTGAISTQVLSFDADGLITGNTYSIMCKVVTSTGMEASTGFVQFPVSYSSSSLGINYQLAQLKNSSAVYLSWDDLGSNILSYPYTDTTKTTNGITFTVNGEGDVVVTGTATADAYFTIAQGTLSQLGITAGQKFIVTSGYSGAKIVVTETNSSNVVVSTITGNDPLQYIATSTTNTLKISIVIPSGASFGTSQQLQPMIAIEDKIVALNDLSVTMQPIQDLHGYANPWPAGGGKNLLNTVLIEGVPSDTSFGNTTKRTFTDGTFVTKLSDNNYYNAGANIQFSVSENFIKVTSSALAYAISIPIVGLTIGEKYVLSCTKTNADNNRVSFYKQDGTFISNTPSLTVCVFTVPEDTYYTLLHFNPSGNNVEATFTDIQLEKGSVPSSYAPYSNICPISGRTGVNVYVSPTQDQQDATTYAVDWTTPAGTVYGGTLDVVTGVLTVDRIGVDGGSVDWTKITGNQYRNFSFTPSPLAKYMANQGTVISSQYKSEANNTAGASDDNYAWIRGSNASNTVCVKDTSKASLSASDFKTAMTGVQFVWELATPLTYQLTPTQVAVLTGTNNVWSTGDSVSVTYTKDTGSQATLSGAIVTFSDSNAVLIPTPQYIPGITGISIYRYLQGESALQHVYDLATGATSILDYYAPSQMQVSYLIVAHSGIGDLFLQTTKFTPTFWFFSILLCDTDSNGDYHVSKEYIFKYGVETGAVSNNNDPTIQKNFTPYPNRQPISTLYKTGKISGYIGKTNNLNRYSDSISLQNAIYDISVSSLDKFLKSRKGDVIKVDTASSIQMKTEDNTVQQALKATVDWVEVGEASQVSIVSVPSDSFWPIS